MAASFLKALRNHGTRTRNYFTNSRDYLPKSVDWRLKGAITPIKSQGNTKACWAFSVVTCVEAINQMAYGKLIPLSDQSIIDCAQRYPCGEGHPEHAFTHIIKQGGIPSEFDYPFTGTYGVCDNTKKKVASIDDYGMVKEEDESALKWIVAHTPVVAFLEASDEFNKHTTGMYTPQSKTSKLNHYVSVIGYGIDKSGRDYWLIRNSYGEEWGDGGYTRVPRNINIRKGCCSIAHFALYPIKVGVLPPFRQTLRPNTQYGRCRCKVCLAFLDRRGSSCQSKMMSGDDSSVADPCGFGHMPKVHWTDDEVESRRSPLLQMCLNDPPQSEDCRADQLGDFRGNDDMFKELKEEADDEKKEKPKEDDDQLYECEKPKQELKAADVEARAGRSVDLTT